MPGGCPLCGSSLDALAAAGKDARICPSCAAVMIARQEVRRLALAATTAELVRVAPEAVESEREMPSLQELAKRAGGACPGCGGKLHPFRYGGGTATALDCRSCDLTVFPKGSLARALDEQRNGTKLTEDQRTALRDARLGWALGGYLGASEIILILGIGSVLVLLRLARYQLPAWLFAALAAGVVAYVIHRARRAERDGREAEARAERIAAAAEHEQRAEAPPVARKGGRMPALATPKTGAPCAWCGAPLPPKATRCDACDSDFA